MAAVSDSLVRTDIFRDSVLSIAADTLGQIINTSVVQIVRDSTTAWYENNTVLHDSIVNTVKANADSISASQFITINGTSKADSAVLAPVALGLNMQAVSDSLVRTDIFRDSVLSIAADTLGQIINTSVVQIVRDSTTAWYENNTVLHDSIVNTVKANADSISASQFITINGTSKADSAVLAPVALGLNMQAVSDSLVRTDIFRDSVLSIAADTLGQIINTSVVQIVRDSTTAWYENNTVLHDSIVNTVKANADSISASQFITINGTSKADSAVLAPVALDLNMQAVSDSLVRTDIFRDSVLSIAADTLGQIINTSVVQIVRDITTAWYENNTVLHDSIVNTVKANADSISASQFITINGTSKADSAVLAPVALDLNMQAVSDSLVRTDIFRDSVLSIAADTLGQIINTSVVQIVRDSTTAWYENNTVLHDSIVNTVKANADSISASQFITINGTSKADSAVLAPVALGLNMQAVSDSLVRTDIFRDSVLSIAADTLGQIINTSVVQIVRDSTTAWYENNTVLHDSIVNTVKANADSISASQFITINGTSKADSAVLAPVALGLNMQAVSDSLVRTDIFRDSVLSIAADTLGQIINTSVVQIVRDSTTAWYENNTVLHDSIVNTVKANADSISASQFITINGTSKADSAVLAPVALGLNMQAVSDSLVRTDIFRDSVLSIAADTLGQIINTSVVQIVRDSTTAWYENNTVLHDSIVNTVKANADSISASQFITINGTSKADSAVLAPVALDLNMQAVSDSLVRTDIFRDSVLSIAADTLGQIINTSVVQIVRDITTAWYENNTVLHDSIVNTVKANADSISASQFITINGTSKADSAVLAPVALDLNMQAVSDSLVRTDIFRDSVLSIAADTLGQIINTSVVQIVRDSTTAWYENNTVLHDSIVNTVKANADSISASQFITINGTSKADSAVLAPVALGLNMQAVSDSLVRTDIFRDSVLSIAADTLGQIINTSVVQIVRDSTTAWYENNTVLHDSIVNTVKANADSISASQFITINGTSKADSAVLAPVALDLNMQAVSDSLVRTDIFRDSVLSIAADTLGQIINTSVVQIVRDITTAWYENNTVLHDSIVNTVKANADSISASQFITINGTSKADSAVLAPVALDLNMQAVSDSLVRTDIFRDSVLSIAADTLGQIINTSVVQIVRDSTTAWYENNTVLHDSIVNTVKANADSISASQFITINGTSKADSAVLAPVALGLNMQAVSDSLVRTDIFRDSVLSIAADTLGQIINTSVVQIVRDSTTAWYENNTVLHDSIVNTVKANADSISASQFITINGTSKADSAVLAPVALGLNMQAVSDSLVRTDIFRDSVLSIAADTLGQIINTSVVQIVRDSTTAWYENNTVLHDSIVSTVKANADSISASQFITINGTSKADSAVLAPVALGLNMQAVSDSLVRTDIFRDSVLSIAADTLGQIINTSVVQIVRDSTTAWYENNTVLHDSIVNTVKANADSLASDNFIAVTDRNGNPAGDSTVLDYARLNLNMTAVSDSLVRTDIFRDSVLSIAADTLGQIINTSVVQIVRDSTTAWYENNTVLH